MIWHRVRELVCSLLGCRYPDIFNEPCTRCGTPSPRRTVQ